MSELNTVTVPVTLSVSTREYKVNISSPKEIDVGVSTAIEAVDAEHYRGPYTVTPGAQAQALDTAGKLMGYNVVVASVPNNYGLITWNGSVLTVS